MIELKELKRIMNPLTKTNRDHRNFLKTRYGINVKGTNRNSTIRSILGQAGSDHRILAILAGLIRNTSQKEPLARLRHAFEDKNLRPVKSDRKFVRAILKSPFRDGVLLALFGQPGKKRRPDDAPVVTREKALLVASGVFKTTTPQQVTTEHVPQPSVPSVTSSAPIMKERSVSDTPPLARTGDFKEEWKARGVKKTDLLRWFRNADLSQDEVFSMFSGADGNTGYGSGKPVSDMYGRIPIDSFRKVMYGVLQRKCEENDVERSRYLKVLHEINDSLLFPHDGATSLSASVETALSDFLLKMKKNFDRKKQGFREISEDDVEKAFVQGLLRVLEWDVESLSSIKRKRFGQHGSPDYLVFMWVELQFIIESKKPTCPLGQKERNQARGYATKRKVPWYGLTNGREFLFFHVSCPRHHVFRISFEGVRWALTPEHKQWLFLISEESFKRNHLKDLWHRTETGLGIGQ